MVESDSKSQIPLNALIIEDSELDMVLLLRSLQEGGFEVTHRRVQNKEDLIEALATAEWQVVISDYSLPAFDAKHALNLVIPHNIPFFVVSGTIGEDIAVEMMRAGAQDYVMKGNLTRLIPAIYRELEEARRRAEVKKVLKQKEDQLRHAQKMEAIGRLAGGIAHDFNNFLGAIQVMSELAESEIDESSKAYSNIQQIQQTVERAASLTRQLLLFSRKQPVQLVELNINSRIENMRLMLKGIVGESIDLKIALDKELDAIQMDPSQFEQTLLNLVVNARDAIPVGGILKISTSNLKLLEPIISRQSKVPPGQYVVLHVEDTGTGMDEATLQCIFEPFFTTKGENGTGIGLSTVFGIVQSVNAHILVASNKGHGTGFKIYFPSDGPSTKTEKSRQSSFKQDQSGTETILVVEDQIHLKEAIISSLKLKSYKVLHAQSAYEALEVFDKHADEIQLVITDLNMPGMNGIGLIKELEKKRKSVKFIVMSGYLDENLLAGEEQQQNPSVQYISKPFAVKSLLEKIRTAFRNS